MPIYNREDFYSVSHLYVYKCNFEASSAILGTCNGPAWGSLKFVIVKLEV